MRKRPHRGLFSEAAANRDGGSRSSFCTRVINFRSNSWGAPMLVAQEGQGDFHRSGFRPKYNRLPPIGRRMAAGTVN